MKLARLKPNSTIADLLTVYNGNLDDLEGYVMSLGIERKVEVFEAEENQTWYKLTKGTYPQSRHSLIVYVGGSISVAGVDFAEATPDSFRLVTPPPKGTRVIAMYSTVANILPDSVIKPYNELVEDYARLQNEVKELRELVNNLTIGGNIDNA